MKALFAALFLFGATVATAAAPDPRDSVIIERKVAGPAAGPCQSAVLKVRVWITNKDSLSAIQLPIVTIEQVRTANATLSRAADCNPNRTFDDVYNVLLPAGQLPNRTADFSRYNSTPPDTFSAMLAGDLSDDLTKVLPNSIRSPLLDIKFDSVSGSAPFGWLVLLSTGIDAGDDIRFVTAQGVPLKVNFFAGLIEVRIPDSVIIESKTVVAQSGPCGSAPLRVKVWITNQDSLANITLPLETRNVSGSAYATLSRPAGCGNRALVSHTFDFLYPPDSVFGIQRLESRSANYSSYHSNPPDTFLLAFTQDDPACSPCHMPPNPTRALLGELKFDSVNANLGYFEIDSGKVLSNTIGFVDLAGRAVPVIFVKGTIYVVQPPPPPPCVPCDSVILESKIVAPQSGPCASAILRVRVYITNRDSLANITLPFHTTTVSGTAYATLSRPASCGARTLNIHTFDFLYPLGLGGGQRLPTRVANYVKYNSSSPDSFLVAFTLDDPANDDGKMPPNLTRQLMGEIKFDSVLANPGQMEIDTGFSFTKRGVIFVDLPGRAIYPNFVKSVITVAPKGDLNLDFALTPADVVLILNCIFLGIPPPAGSGFCDLNCDGLATAADFVLLLNATFLGDPFPC